MSHIGVKNWDPNEMLEMEYPSPENMNWTFFMIRFICW